MNRLQTTLSEILSANRLREKILIAPSFSSGYQIAESLVKEGCPYLNLRIKTVFSLAHDIVAIDLSSDSVSFLSEISILMFIEDIFNEHKRKKGSYFANIEIKSGIINALAGAIYKLRICGIGTGDLTPNQFVNEQKGGEIIEILKQYETILEDKKYADYPKVLQRAIDKITRNDIRHQNLLYLVVSDMALSALEKRFIELLPIEKIMLPHDIPEGLIYPDNYMTFSGIRQDNKPKSDIELMPWLFCPEKALPAFNDSSVQMFHAVGKRNEVREVIRRILSSSVACDDTELIYTSYDDYVPLIYETAIKFGIKLTIEEGIPIAFTRCGRAVLGIISWIASNYEAIQFRQLLAGGCIDLQSAMRENISPSPSIMGKIIRESTIEWGRERYILVLEQMQDLYSSQLIDDEDNDEKKEFHEIKENNTKLLIEMLKDIFGFIPEPDEKRMVSISGLCNGVMKFNDKYCRVSDELDAEAKSAIRNLLDEIAKLSSRELEIQDALSRIEIIVKGIRVGQSSPKSGSIHAAPYKTGGRSGRRHTYILGCDFNLFPGSTIQNPILLDSEMLSISTALIPSTALLKENLYRMAALLSSLKGSVTLSFSSFDVLDGRESFPSSLLLQVHRLMTGNITSDYTELINVLGIPSGYVPDITPIDGIDYWIQKFSGRYGLKKVDAGTLGLYPGLLRGIKASDARESDALTVYDGRIASDEQLDPRENRGIILSASMIEKFAKCPFSYFLAYVLKVKPLQERKLEKSEWLDALERGRLLHELFYRFMSDITKKKEKPSFQKHLEYMRNLTDEIINEYRRNIPPPVAAVFEQERNRIFKTAEAFLRLEESHCKDREPLLFEVPFGCSHKDVPVELREPLKIELENGQEIAVRGLIDRIDRRGDHEYEVWDYKTGSTYGYMDNEFFSGGKVIQHALYAIAAEEILKLTKKDNNPSVKQSGYFFPTDKGTGRRFLKPRDDEKLKQLLITVFNIINSGIFIPSDKKDSCTYCDYKTVCSPDVFKLTEKKLNDQNTELSEISRLKKYD